MRRAMGPLALVGALLLAAAPLSASADTSVGEHGWTGDHHLVDTQASPGAWCGYVRDDEYPLLYLVRVEPPVVFARDRTPGRDGQVVGWRIQLLAWVPDHDEYWTYHLVQVAAGPLHRAWVTDDRAAAFSADTMAIVKLERGFQIRIRMSWYKASDPTELAGSSRDLVDWYAVEGSTPWEGCTGIVY